jgi:alpha-1,2-mannosyltransferase
MALTNGPLLPLSIAFLIMFITIVPGGGYVALKTWFYFLNSRFRRRSAGIREKLAKEATLSEAKNRAVFVGFFHPYWYWFPATRLRCSNAGGGGERVLWTAIKTIQQENPEVISVVYSGDTEVTPQIILDNVQVYPWHVALTIASF